MVQALTADKLKTIYKLRMPEGHKGTFGHALLMVGNTGKMGAAVIAAHSCMRGGCGLVTVSIPFEERSIIQTTLPEAMVISRLQTPSYMQYDAVGIGCALGLDDTASNEILELLQSGHQQLVLDADAITILSQHPQWLSYLPAQTILTPHVKEFDRLVGSSLTMDDREEKARQFAAKHNCIVVLKHHKTWITDGDNCFRNTTGNSGLAKGGSGDALLGLITSLRAQGYTAMHAAMIAVYLHGLAADVAVEKSSEEAVLITDVILSYGEAFRNTF